jgi:hypothetical protein
MIYNSTEQLILCTVVHGIFKKDLIRRFERTYLHDINMEVYCPQLGH